MCYGGYRSGVFTAQGLYESSGFISSSEEFRLHLGLVLGRSAPGLLIQRQAFQKILWSGSQADLARWLPSEGITETPTSQPPWNKLIPDPAVWLDVGVNSDRTQILPVADKTSGFDS